jgi:DNA-binding CsgD family transcriptional regulator
MITPLTDSQKRVAAQLVRGATNSEIATRLHLAPETVKTHLRAIRAQLNCKARCSRPVLAHTLLIHEQVGPPDAPRRDLTPTEAEMRLWRALAEHSRAADIAQAAGVTHKELYAQVQALTHKAGASDATHLVGIGHALQLLGKHVAAGADGAVR